MVFFEIVIYSIFLFILFLADENLLSEGGIISEKEHNAKSTGPPTLLA